MRRGNFLFQRGTSIDHPTAMVGASGAPDIVLSCFKFLFASSKARFVALAQIELSRAQIIGDDDHDEKYAFGPASCLFGNPRSRVCFGCRRKLRNEGIDGRVCRWSRL